MSPVHSTAIGFAASKSRRVAGALRGSSCMRRFPATTRSQSASGDGHQVRPIAWPDIGLVEPQPAHVKVTAGVGTIRTESHPGSGIRWSADMAVSGRKMGAGASGWRRFRCRSDVSLGAAFRADWRSPNTAAWAAPGISNRRFGHSQTLGRLWPVGKSHGTRDRYLFCMDKIWRNASDLVSVLYRFGPRRPVGARGRTGCTAKRPATVRHGRRDHAADTPEVQAGADLVASGCAAVAFPDDRA